MATRLEQLGAAVHERLAAAMPDAPVKDYYDRVALTMHQQRRRIVWITEGGTTEPPRQGGGRTPTDGSPSRAQACRIRVEAIDAYAFAENRERTEQLLDALIAAVCTVLQVVEIPTYRWTTEEVSQAGQTLRVAAVVLRINARLPVAEEIKPLSPILGADDLCGTIQPDGSFKPQG